MSRAVGRVARVLVGHAAVGREVLPPRGEVEDDEVGAVHHRRLGRGSNGERDLARRPGAMSYSSAVRVPRTQAQPGAGEHVAAAAARRRRRRTGAARGRRRASGPSSGTRARSVTCALTLSSLRDFMRFACCASVRSSGHTQRDERDALAVGEPLERRRAGGERGQPPRLAAVGRDQVDLRLGVVLALRGEGDVPAVRRPRGSRCPCRPP